MTALASLALYAALLVPTEPKVDLLVVVDDSRSMSDDQARLRYELPALTGDLHDADWQIAVVTTSSPCLRGNRVLRKSDPDAAQAFAQMIDAGTAGDADERGIAVALDAVKGKCAAGDKPWIRDDATIALLFVSDEDSGAGDPAELVAYLKSLRPVARLHSYALIWQRADPKCRLAGNESEGLRYREVSASLGGLVGSICQNDFTQFLEALSRDLRETLTSSR